MSLRDLLAEKGIRSALIVDDVCDVIPTANDIDPGNEAWPTFNDDLNREQLAQIACIYPNEGRFDELIADDAYVATIWNLRNDLGEICNPIFEGYINDQSSDQNYIDLARQKLESLGLTCETSGRDFNEAAQTTDLILIDLFFSKTQDDTALSESKQKLREALSTRRSNPPLVILMSRSPRLEAKRDEFRDDVGLLDSAFRIIKKSDLDEGETLERQLGRLAENAEDSLKLATFFTALEDGMDQATSRALELFRKIRLSDIGQIQQLLLSAEGESTGSYLVDVFDRVLQHEIERDTGIISAAKRLNGFSSASHPPPYVSGSPELQELVERLHTQNIERLDLPGSLESQVTFGDILKMTANTDTDRLKSLLLVDTGPDKVLLVLTPACDLQRSGAPRILLLVGALKPLEARTWSYGDDARTPVIRIDGELNWIKWDLKHIDTVSHEQLRQAFDNSDLEVAARLREAHTIELQQRALSGLGRIGMVATLPATFPVDLEVYYANTDGVVVSLEVPALAEGAVCFVGRDENSNPALRLIMTDHACDNIIDTLNELDENRVSETARSAFSHVRSTPDLQSMLTGGICLKGAKNNTWSHIPSKTGADKNVTKMGLLAWNHTVTADPLHRRDLNKAGIILLVKDKLQAEAPGLEDAVRSGLVQPAITEPDPE